MDVSMRFLAPALAVLLLSTTSSLAEIKVAVSIKPVHSIVAAVMKGVGEPSLIIDGANSPHTYVMKPSDAEMLEKAQAVIWVGEALEPSLEKPIEALSGSAKVLSLMETKSIKTLDIREGNIFGEDHEEGEHAEENADEHAGEEHAKKPAGDEHDHDHASSKTDAHIWLDPENAKLMAVSIADFLAEIDAANGQTYKANAQALAKDFDVLSAEITSTLKGTDNSFIVFHDAYQYFEKRFAVASKGAIAIHPENPPGAKALSEIRNYITDKKITCVYAEPQFDPKLVGVITEGTSAKSAVLDPLGASLNPGPELYPTLLKTLATSLKSC
jgi:zinc transport system substrate-binding protein